MDRKISPCSLFPAVPVLCRTVNTMANVRQPCWTTEGRVLNLRKEEQLQRLSVLPEDTDLQTPFGERRIILLIIYAVNWAFCFHR